MRIKDADLNVGLIFLRHPVITYTEGCRNERENYTRGDGHAERGDRRLLSETVLVQLAQNEKNPLNERVLKFLLSRLNYRAITLAAEGPLAPLVISNSTR